MLRWENFIKSIITIINIMAKLNLEIIFFFLDELVAIVIELKTFNLYSYLNYFMAKNVVMFAGFTVFYYYVFQKFN